MALKIKKLYKDSKIPTYADPGAAGMDLYAYLPEEGVIAIPGGEAAKIKTGIAVEIPHGYFGGIYARSGLAFKKNLRPVNAVGVIDETYRGEIVVGLYNDSPFTQRVAHGERIAQMVIQPYVQVELEEVEDLSETERGTGGFGSSGRF